MLPPLVSDHLSCDVSFEGESVGKSWSLNVRVCRTVRRKKRHTSDNVGQKQDYSICEGRIDSLWLR